MQHMDCNEDLASGTEGDGCETEIVSDIQNCGACELACEQGPGILAECEDRRCFKTSVRHTQAGPIGSAEHGAASGGTAYDQRCAAGQALVGIRVAGDASFVLGIGAVCAPLDLHGSPAGPFELALGTQQEHELSGGQPAGANISPSTLLCPSGEVVTRVDGGIGTFASTLTCVTQLTLTCSTISLDGMNAFRLQPSGTTLSSGSVSDQGTFSDVCLEGQVAIGFTGRSGDIIDGLQTHCAALEVARERSVGMIVK
jgi:hypothetical protein